MYDVSFNGALNLIGSVIRIALEDFKLCHDHIDKLELKYDRLLRKKRGIRTEKLNKLASLIRNYRTARSYLFKKDQLEYFLNKTGLCEHVDIGYIRRCALSDEVTLMRPQEARIIMTREEEVYG